MSAATVRKIKQPPPYPTEVTCVNPATGKTIGTVPCLPLEELPRVFDEARSAQKIWAALTFEQRRDQILKVRDYLIEHDEEIADVISQSNGKTLSDAMNTEVLPSILACDWYAKKAKKYLKKQRLAPSNVLVANKASHLLHVPHGVVGILSPWNYPFAIPFGEIIMGLMAGNAILYKTAEETALVGAEIEKALKAADLPAGLTQFMVGNPPDISTAWFEHGIDKIFFTGSVRVGKLLMKQASETLTPISLELGGNDAMVVMEDANLERAANGAVWAGFQNCGQSCAGVERVFVDESVAEEFVELVSQKTAGLRQGVEQGNFDVDVGSLTVPRQRKTVERHVKDAVKKGAVIAAQAQVTGQQADTSYPATVLTEVTDEMEVMREETFGPVIAIQTFQGEEEMIRLANNSQYGLTSSLWTMDTDRGKRLAEKLESGITTINDHLFTFGMAELPWVGWKNSGVGLSHSHLGLQEMTKVKVVNYDLAPNLNTNLWWFPHRKIKYDIFRKTVNLLFGKTVKDKSQSLMELTPAILKDPLLLEKTRYVLKRAQKKGSKNIKKRMPV